jgi:hypothetical protein
MFLSPFSKLLIASVVIPAGIYGIYALYADVPSAKQADVYGLRPCFEEEIRLEAARFWLGQTRARPTDIERFNGLVDAYNKSCGHRTVSRRGQWGVDVIQSEARANRDALWAEGIARFQGAQ